MPKNGKEGFCDSGNGPPRTRAERAAALSMYMSKLLFAGSRRLVHRVPTGVKIDIPKMRLVSAKCLASKGGTAGAKVPTTSRKPFEFPARVPAAKSLVLVAESV